jgi:hypothetical protein
MCSVCWIPNQRRWTTTSIQGWWRIPCAVSAENCRHRRASRSCQVQQDPKIERDAARNRNHNLSCLRITLLGLPWAQYSYCGLCQLIHSLHVVNSRIVIISFSHSSHGISSNLLVKQGWTWEETGGPYKDRYNPEGHHEYTPLLSLTETILVTIQTAILFNPLKLFQCEPSDGNDASNKTVPLVDPIKPRLPIPPPSAGDGNEIFKSVCLFFTIYAMIVIYYCRAKLVSLHGLAVSLNGQKSGRTDPPLHPIPKETGKIRESRSVWFVRLFDLPMQSNHFSG